MTNRDLQPNVTTRESELVDIHGNKLVDTNGNELVVIGPEIEWSTEWTPN